MAPRPNMSYVPARTALHVCREWPWTTAVAPTLRRFLDLWRADRDSSAKQE